MPSLRWLFVRLAFYATAGVVLFVNVPAASAEDPLDGIFMATAYKETGITASGQYVHRHVVAADPSILPIGSLIKIRHAGRYSGEYVVADTGEKIQGRKLDIYVPSVTACKKFGSRPVRVRVVQRGDGTRATVKQADQTVKADVAKDVQKNVVGNAATQDDWKAKAGAANNGSPAKADESKTPANSPPGP